MRLTISGSSFRLSKEVVHHTPSQSKRSAISTDEINSIWSIFQVDQGIVPPCHKSGWHICYFYRWNWQHLPSTKFSGRRVHSAYQDWVAEANGRSGQFQYCWQNVPAVCHQLPMGTGLSLHQEVSEEDIYPPSRQVQFTLYTWDIQLNKASSLTPV